jgi:hypothetical protein
MNHAGGRFCWCAPAFTLMEDGRICVIHYGPHKRRDVARAWFWTAVQM